jgi:hypothetical protein
VSEDLKHLLIYRKVRHLIDHPAKLKDWSYRDLYKTLIEAIEFGRDLERKTYVKGHSKRQGSVFVRGHLRRPK